MISYLDIFWGNELWNQFDNVLDDKNDILFVPPEWGISERRDQQERLDNEGLNLPYFTVWREPFNHNPQMRNAPTQFKRETFNKPSQSANAEGFKIQTMPFETEYTIEYWDDIQGRTNEFNMRWLKRVDVENSFTIDVPLDGVSFLNGTASIAYQPEYGTITDNSDIPRKNEVGADIRYSCQVVLEGLTYQFDGDAPAKIDKIALDFYVQENGVDDLVRQMEIT